MQTDNDNLSILVVDDEPDICDILQFNLENEGYAVESVTSAEEALEKMKGDYHLILLDVMMGGMSGFKLADRLRKSGNEVPIIFLTAKNTENDMLTGFSLGADDYIAKPFSIKEVIARVRSVLRRTLTTDPVVSPSDLLKIEGLSVGLSSKTVTVDSQPVELTKTEFNILVLLVQHPGRVFSRTNILDNVWPGDGIVLERTVDVHIARLRKKIGRYGDYIVNRTGHGYCFYLHP
jgi:Response regulators consisting of a CheY-like receiver domain and a winged-helix DNA-binding domain